MKRTSAIIFRSVLLLLAGVIIGLLLNNSARNDTGDGNDKISRSLDLVNKYYVDPVNTDSIQGVTVNSMLQNLDPHSLYLPPQQAQSINEKLDGGFNGLGIEYQLLRDTLIITQVYNGGPARQAGILTGSRVISINNKKFAGTHLTPAIVNKVFRGGKNSDITLGILTKDNKSIKLYNLKRGHVDLSSLDAAYLADATTGYIKISKFASTTDEDFRNALKKLQKDGMKKLVLDLRGNGGGYLNSATELASEFLDKGKLVVFTKGVHEPRKDYFATDSGLFQQGKVAVLIDEYSASASEILAGALQDLDRAVIVGRRSFGKGLVQQQFAFGDGSAINLTVARYYTPSGGSIQKSYKGGVEQYRNELAGRMRKGELFSEENYLKDSSFKRDAYHTSAGRKVYSGGGIMPDIFVAADTSGNTMLLQELSTNQLFNAYVIDKMQPVLDSFNTGESYLKNYRVSDNEFNDFIVYSSKTLKEMDPNDIRLSKDNIKMLLKAFAARYKWGDMAYFQVLNSSDNTVKKAIAAID